jgi:RNA polymerase sigma factor (sigma-70 family)
MASGQLNAVVHHLRQVVCHHDGRSDGQLLEAFRTHRDAASFEAIVRRHGAMVLGVCRRLLGNLHDAEDAFQATFLVLYRKADSIARPELVGNWLYGVAHYTATNARVSARRRRAREKRVSEMAATADLQSEGSADVQSLLDQLARLPERLRVPVVLCYLEGKTRKEVARQLGCAEGTVSSRLARAQKLLRERLSRRGWTVLGGSVAVALSREAVGAAPASLIRATVRTALTFAAVPGAGAAGTSEKVLALATATLRGLFTAPARALSAWVLGLAVLSAGASLALTFALPAVRSGSDSTAPRVEIAPPAVDRYGDPLPPGVIARLGTTRLRPGHEVLALAFSPDGETLASTIIRRNTVALWDVATGRLLREFAGHPLVLRLAFTPDGERLVSGGMDQTMRVWDVATGRRLRRIATADPKDGAFAGSASFVLSPDGRVAAVLTSDRLTHLWDLRTGAELPRVGGSDSAVLFESIPLAFSSDGKTLATRQDRYVRLWEVATGKELRRIDGFGGNPWVAAFAGNRLIVASRADERSLDLWEIAGHNGPRRLKAMKGVFSDATFSRDAKLLSLAGPAGPPTLLDTATGRTRPGLTGDVEGATRSMAISPDGRTVAGGSQGGVIHLWDTASGQERQPAGGHQGRVEAVAFATGGTALATASLDGTCRHWDPATGRETQLLRGHWNTEGALVLSPGGRLVAARTEGEAIGVWDTAMGQEVCRLVGHEGGVCAIAFGPGGHTLVSAAHDQTVRLWDVATGKELTRLGQPPVPPLAPGVPGPADALAICPEGRYMALGAHDRLLCLRGLDAGQPHFEVPDEVRSVAFSPDGKTLAVAGPGATVRLWEVFTGGRRVVLERRPVARPRTTGPSGTDLEALAFAPNGRTLAAGGSDATIWLWDLATGRELARLTGHRGPIRSLAFSPNGKLLASAGGVDTTALVWDVSGRRPMANLAPGLSPERLDVLWAELAGADAARAYSALWALAGSPSRSVPFLRARLERVRPVGARRFARLLRNLDDDSFAVRERASAELEELGDDARPCTVRALVGDLSAEVRSRLERLLARLQQHRGPSASVQVMRALEVLAHAATPEAFRLLRDLAGRHGDDWLGQEAREMVEHLDRL